MSQSAAKAFAQRFNQACDDSPIIPEHGKGRQVVIANHMKLSQEAVRKWFEGDSMPLPPKMRVLAEYLDVDEAWLALGIPPEADRPSRKLTARVASGAVDIVSGLIKLEGGNAVGPGERDSRSSYVDLYAFMDGSHAALHVCTGRETEPDTFELIVPREYPEAHCIGFIPAGVGKYSLIDLPTDLIDAHKQRKAGDFAITLTRVGTHYRSESDTWPRFTSFREVVR